MVINITDDPKNTWKQNHSDFTQTLSMSMNIHQTKQTSITQVHKLLQYY